MPCFFVHPHIMKLYLVRHGRTTWNEENRIQGSKNPGLSLLGQREARQLARRLKKEKISLIYASDRLRCRKTAQILQKTLHTPLRYEKGLREIDLGAWEGKTPEEVNRQFRDGYQKWLKAPSRVRIPGAESVTRFRKRVLEAFRKLLQQAPEGNIVVVSHGGVISTFLASLLKGSEDAFLLRLRLDNAGISVVRVRNRYFTVVCSVNDTSHLGSLS